MRKFRKLGKLGKFGEGEPKLYRCSPLPVTFLYTYVCRKLILLLLRVTNVWDMLLKIDNIEMLFGNKKGKKGRWGWESTI